MPLSTQAQGLNAKEKLLGGKGIKAGTQVALNLDPSTNDEGDGTKGVPELESMITRRGLNELRKSLAILAPVKFARVDYDTSNGGTVAANPFGSGVNNNVGSMVDWPNEVSARTKRVVNLF